MRWREWSRAIQSWSGARGCTHTPDAAVHSPTSTYEARAPVGCAASTRVVLAALPEAVRLRPSHRARPRLQSLKLHRLLVAECQKRRSNLRVVDALVFLASRLRLPPPASRFPRLTTFRSSRSP